MPCAEIEDHLSTEFRDQNDKKKTIVDLVDDQLCQENGQMPRVYIPRTLGAYAYKSVVKRPGSAHSGAYS